MGIMWRMIRLFNENGCETPTDSAWGKIVSDAIRPMVKDAVDAGISLRDLQTLVIEEVSVLCAEERLRRGIAERKANREAWAAQAKAGMR